MRYSVSDTAEHGDYTAGPRIVTDETKREMQRILDEIQSGAYARRWIAENEAGRPKFNATRDGRAHPELEQVGAQLRGDDAVPGRGRGDGRRGGAQGVRQGGSEPYDERSSRDLRHHAARRRAVAGLQHAHGREGAHGAPARAAGRRHHRGRLPDRLAPATSRPCRRSSARGQGAPRSRRSAAAAARTSRRAARRSRRAAPPRIHTFLATSALHLEYKLQDLARGGAAPGRRGASGWPGRFAEDVEFSAEDASRTDYGFLQRGRCRRSFEAGARTLNIPDTVGYALPDEYARDGRASWSRDVPARRDLASTATTTSASPSRTRWRRSQAGARQIECTINGIGERAGNTSLEEVVMALTVRREVLGFETGIRHARSLARASSLLSTVTGVWPQPNKAIVGRNAFAHEAGIHQDGMLGNPLDLRDHDARRASASRRRMLVLGKHSGKHAVESRLKAARRRPEGGRGRARSRAGQGPRRPDRSSSTTRTCSRSSSMRPSRARQLVRYQVLVGQPASCPTATVEVGGGGHGALGLGGRQRPARRGAARRSTRPSASSCELLELHTRAVTSRQGRARPRSTVRVAPRRDDVARPGREHRHRSTRRSKRTSSAVGLPPARRARRPEARPRAGARRATLLEKIWDAHLVRAETAETPAILYVDLHLVHEVTSPQAFTGLRARGLQVRRPERTVATMDHSIPTRPAATARASPTRRRGRSRSRRSSATAREFGITLYALGSERQGIVHVIGPELGLTQPGHDHRLRRQPHGDARRLRCAGLRHRHERGRARAGDAVPAAAQAARRCAVGVDGRARRRASPPRTSSSALIARIGVGGGAGYVDRVPRLARSARCRWKSA